MASTVREQSGIGFAGGEYAESFALADVRLAGDAVPDGEVILYFSPAGMMVAAPLPGGVYQLVAAVDEAPQHPDAAFLQALLDSRGHAARRAAVTEVLWGSRFRVHHRVADRLTRLATAPRPARNLLLRTLGSMPAVRRRFAMQLSGLVYR
jgi:2-polyprenyl-6-methoxyphenol hydroxylase-like FAD-dependent oxidoreductase